MKLLLMNAQGASAWIGIEEICLVVPSKNGPVFTAKDGALYRYPHTMEQLVLLFGDYGYHRLDRNVVANLEAAERYDPELRKVYFGQTGDDPGEELYATVSAANASKVMHLAARESAGSYGAYEAA